MSAEQQGPRPKPRGTFVELVRLALVALFTAGGWQIAQSMDLTGTQLLVAVLLGSLVGFVIGGVLGRRAMVAVSSLEEDFKQVPASEILAGAIGLILGLAIAALSSVFLFRLPPAAAVPVSAFVALLLGFVGYRLGRSKRDEVIGMFGLKSRLAARGGEANVLDTSTLIDGRILEVVQAGFLGGTFLVTRGVLKELQAVADASDPARRARGRRGLDALRWLQRSPEVAVELVEEAAPDGDVDALLVRVARDRGAALVTEDANLRKVAAALDVPTRSVWSLSQALRPTVVPGEEVTVLLTKEGREHGQGVGYLDDGTMVVVERGSDLLGKDVTVTVTNVLQTTAGRLVFARLGSG